MPIIPILIVFLFPVLTFSQVDNIQLPDVELVIEDQSSLRTDNTEEALLKDRNPQFQEVYLEELSSSSIRDSSYQVIQSQRLMNKFSTVNFGYGSYNNTKIDFLSQNTISNLVYSIDYAGAFLDNVGYNKTKYYNTQKFSNKLNATFSYALQNTLMDVSLTYDQKKQSFFTNTEFQQDYHYIPLSFDISHWVTENSYIKFDTDVRTAVARLENGEGRQSGHRLMTENDFSLSYHANFADWNYFTFATSYQLNSYDTNLEHTGKVTLASDFNIGKGFTTTVGATIVGSTADKLFGWPELALGYSYYDVFLVKLGFSGDYNVFGAADLMDKEEFYADKAITESRWTAALSLFAKPSAFFWVGSKFSYHIYQNKNIFSFDSNRQLYTFESAKNVDTFEAQVSLGSTVHDIFEVTAAYTYQYFNKSWLLFAPHQFDIILGLGYKPVGFWFESSLTLLSDRQLREDLGTPMATLLNIKISQQVSKIARLSLELNNILNQNIQISQGSFYGGFQARGAVQLYF